MHVKNGVRRLVMAHLLVVAATWAAAQPAVRVTGVVRDSSGAAIPGASVDLRAAHFSSSIKTDSDGHFAFESVPDGTGSVRVSAPGFTSAVKQWAASSAVADLTLTLEAAAASEQIVVSATRSEMKLADVPGSVAELAPGDLAANPALTLDDRLRQVPGFALFRRSSSRVSNPTSQGVSLRGLGASGPSRALVLEDGVPLVDPFGGWVYWDRVPSAELSSVEVFRGGASNLYGSDALGGVIEFLTQTPEAPALAMDVSYGNENTPDLSLWGGTAVGHWDFGAAADMSRTDGYILVPPFQRGLVDTEANSKHATVDGSLGYRFSGNSRAFLRGTFFEESRANGTPLQANSTGTGFGVAGVNTGIGDHDWLSAQVYGQAQGYDQTFSSIAANRNSEKRTDIQHVPSQQLGGAAQWNHVFRSQTLIAGVDSQEVMGASDEQLFSTATGFHFANNIAGGRQRSTGIFGQDIFRLGAKWTIIAGVRWDDWSNFDARTVRIATATGSASGTDFADRSDTAFNPRLSLLREVSQHASIYVSGYRAFRAPTLNELYRSFRQGPVTTLSNALLRAERSTGAEAGTRVTGFDSKLVARATVFWSDIIDPVTNVTLGPTTRQRQNLGRTRSVGTELDGSFRLSSSIQFSGGYQFTHATVVDSVPPLIGRYVPEVPRHQFSWEARYWNPSRLLVSVQGRYSSLQYDDDLNTLPLKPYYVMDVFIGRSLKPGITAYVGAENLLNQRYLVTLVTPTPPQTQPLENLGPPILARVGIRIDWPAHRN
jgi:outer membrane receptor protein involved in Fe transport